MVDRRQRRLALAEAQVLRRLSHPNLITYVATLLEGQRLVVIMEYAAGGDLASRIAAAKLAQCHFQESEIMHVFVQLAAALMHVHSRRILHRNLKPHNIFLTKQGVVKLGDFCLAKVLDSGASSLQTSLSMSPYLAPEVYSGAAYSSCSDIWALGVVAYELGALRLPFHAKALPAAVVRICVGQADPLPEHLSKDFVHLVFALLEREPTRRAQLEELRTWRYPRQFAGVTSPCDCHDGVGGPKDFTAEAPMPPIFEFTDTSPRASRSKAAHAGPRWRSPKMQQWVPHPMERSILKGALEKVPHALVGASWDPLQDLQKEVKRCDQESNRGKVRRDCAKAAQPQPHRAAARHRLPHFGLPKWPRRPPAEPLGVDSAAEAAPEVPQSLRHGRWFPRPGTWRSPSRCQPQEVLPALERLAVEQQGQGLPPHSSCTRSGGSAPQMCAARVSQEVDLMDNNSIFELSVSSSEAHLETDDSSATTSGSINSLSPVTLPHGSRLGGTKGRREHRLGADAGQSFKVLAAESPAKAQVRAMLPPIPAKLPVTAPAPLVGTEAEGLEEEKFEVSKAGDAEGQGFHEPGRLTKTCYEQCCTTM